MRNLIPKQIKYWAIIIIGIIFFTEVLIRIYYFGSKSLIPHYGNSINPFGSKELTASKFCEIRFELKPNLKIIKKMVPFKTNKIGLRDKEYNLKKLPNTYRVAVFGDSWTVAAGVREKEIFPSLLENHYNKSNKLKYEFINFAVNGYTLEQNLGTILLKGLDFEPDHIIMALTAHTDIPIRYKPSCKINLKNYSQPYTRYWTYTFIKKNIKKIQNKIYGISPSINRIEKRRNLFDINKLDLILGKVKKLTLDKGIGLTIISLRYSNSGYDYESKLIEKTSKKYNIDFIDIGKYLIGDMSDYYIYRYDSHPNTLAHKIIADTIKKEIKFK